MVVLNCRHMFDEFTHTRMHMRKRRRALLPIDDGCLRKIWIPCNANRLSVHYGWTFVGAILGCPRFRSEPCMQAYTAPKLASRQYICDTVRPTEVCLVHPPWLSRSQPDPGGVACASRDYFYNRKFQKRLTANMPRGHRAALILKSGRPPKVCDVFVHGN